LGSDVGEECSGNTTLSNDGIGLLGAGSKLNADTRFDVNLALSKLTSGTQGTTLLVRY
jgi:hypothetical protein